MLDFKLNGKTYQINDKIDFSTIVAMEEKGVSLMELGNSKQTFTQIRNLVAFFLNITPEEASDEISSHIANGGKISDVFSLFEILGKSDFFQQIATQK